MQPSHLTIRRLTRDDGAVVDAVFHGLSGRSRYLRFHSPVPRLSASMRTALLNVDGRDRVALMAELRDHERRVPVGIARFARTGPGEAELAVAVVDSWQGRGVGRRLLTELGEVARDLGYTRLHGLVRAAGEAGAQPVVERQPGAPGEPFQQ